MIPKKIKNSVIKLTTIAYHFYSNHKVNDFFSHYWKVIAILTFALLYSPLFAQNSDTKGSLLGEHEQFDVRYGIFKVGEADIYIDHEFRYPDGVTPHYLVNFKARSTGFLRFIYSDVDVCIESLVSAVNSRPFSTYRSRKNGKKESSHYDFYVFDDSLKIKTINVLKKKEARRTYDRNKQIKDVLGAYIYFKEIDMRSMTKERRVYCYLSKKLNEVIVIPSEENLIETDDYRRFKLLFPNVQDLPQNDKSYALISKESGEVIKISLSLDFGNVSFNLKKD